MKQPIVPLAERLARATVSGVAPAHHAERIRPDVNFPTAKDSAADLERTPDQVGHQIDRPAWVDVPGPAELAKGLGHSAAEALGWKMLEVATDAVSPGAGRAVHGLRVGLTWLKIGYGLATGDGMRIVASIQEQHGFTLDLSARIGARREVSPFGLGVGWSPTEQASHTKVDLELGEGVASAHSGPEFSGDIAVRWVEPTPGLRSSSPATRRGSQPATPAVRAGLVECMQLRDGRKIKPLKGIAVLELVAPVRQVLGTTDVFSADAVATYAEHLGVLERNLPTPGWYLRTGNHGVFTDSQPCRASTIVYLDSETGFGAIILLPVNRPLLISHIGMTGAV